MRKFLCSLICVTFIVFSATAMTSHNQTRVNEIYERLSEQEQFFFIKLSGETLNAGYYSQLKGFSHEVEVAHMQRVVEQNVRTMKRSGQYRSILRRAGTGQQHIAQHLEQCYKLGVEHAHHANREETRSRISPGDIYSSLYEEKVPLTLPSLPRLPLPSGEQVMKVLFISFLILLTLAALAGLIGACVCPQLPVFNRVRALLEY